MSNLTGGGQASHPGRAAIRALLVGGLAVLVGAGAALGTVLHLIDAEAGQGPLPERWQRGVNLTAFLPQAYARPAARRATLTARAAGARLVALTPTWYQQDASSTEIARDPDKTPSDESIAAAARTAHALGLEVAIKPHIDVLDGTFRGEIGPSDREAWFASYERMLDGCAELADEVDAEVLVVGTELTSMSGDEDAWRRILDGVEARFDGELTFAANWVDGAELVRFWDRLDFIGIDAYMPLATGEPEPSVERLVTAWGPYVVRMAALADAWDRPLLFPELGYRSVPGAAADPAGVATPAPEAGSEQALAGERAQADAYEAAFQALAGEEWFDGIWWWEWSAEGLAPEPGGFSPQGRPAELVLAAWQR